MTETHGKQPVPIVNDADVERVVRRDFDGKNVATVLSMLRTDRDVRWEDGLARIQLAILKRANGELTKVREYLDVALIDYRDVLAPAEYPSYMRMFDSGGPETDAEGKKAIDDDWREYQDWLTR